MINLNKKQESNLKVQCEVCQQPASHIYMQSGKSLNLCDRCFDRYQVQDAYECRLLDLDQLARQGDYENALKILNDVYDSYRSQDSDGWLEHTIISHKALIFAEQGKYNEALNAYRILAKKKFAEPSEFLVNQLAIARILDQIGRSEEALLELEQGLNSAQDSSVPTALSLFVQYAKIAKQRHKIIPFHYRQLLIDVIKYFGIKNVPDDLLNNPKTLSSAIMMVHRENLEAQLRYEELQKRLSNSKEKSGDPQNIYKILQEYVDNEPVDFYRNMVLHLMRRNP